MKKSATLIILSALHCHGGHGMEHHELSQETVFTNNSFKIVFRENKDALSSSSQVTISVINRKSPEEQARELEREKNRALLEFRAEVKKEFADTLTKEFNSPTYSHITALDIAEMKISLLKKININKSNKYHTQEYIRDLKKSGKDLTMPSYNIPERTELGHSVHWESLKAIDELIHEIENNKEGKL